MPAVLTNGVRLNVAELGTAVLGVAPAVVMVHGLLLGNLATWYLGPGAILASRRRVICYDLRGHGRSERPARGYAVTAMASDLLGLLDALELDTVDLVGHSYGALIALELSLRHPGRVRRRVLVEPPLASGDLGEIEAFLSRSPDQMLASLPAGLDLGGRRARRLLEGMVALASQTELVAVLAERVGVPVDSLTRLGRETLLVYGSDSPLHAQASRIQALAPSVRVETLPGGHFLPLQAAGPLAALIAQHLEARDG